MKKVVHISGPLRGHVCSVSSRRGLSKWQAYVRLLANSAGVPDRCPQNGASIVVHVYWRMSAKIDTENVGKAILDAIWKKDRRCLEVHYIGHEDTEDAGAGGEFAQAIVTF